MEKIFEFQLESLYTILESFLTWQYENIWILYTALLAYLSATLYYWYHLYKVQGKIHLAPISVKGGLAHDLGAKTIGLMLLDQMQAITQIFKKATDKHASIQAAEAVAADFTTMNITLAKATTELPETKITLKKDLVVKIGTVEVPIGEILNLFFLIFKIIPVPFKKRYYNSMIHLSIISTETETNMVVFRKKNAAAAPKAAGQEAANMTGEKSKVHTRNRIVTNPSEMSDLLRDAVFFILELEEKLNGNKGLSMRYLSDGLNALNAYRFTAEDKLLGEARRYFGQAVKEDDTNYEALYFYASMLYFERTQHCIDAALKLFKKAEKTDSPKLKALVYTGLACCYAQRFHRLAKREKDVLAKSREMSEKAAEYWKKATESEKPHSLILYVQALQGIIDEGTEGKKPEIKERYIQSAILLWQAIQAEPEDNCMFYNSLGWLYLKLAEWNYKRLRKSKNLPEELAGNIAKKSEYFLRYALEINPNNKRSHANLCLLYAAPYFRKQPGNYIHRCRYHGLKAVYIDDKYINGYRDLAVSLIRYGELDEAYNKYFIKALQTADPVAKDLEIINDVVKVLKEMKVEDKEFTRWKQPDPELLKPHKPPKAEEPQAA